MELRLSGSGPAELGELSAGEDEEEESEPVPKPLLRFGGRRSSSERPAWGLGGGLGGYFQVPPPASCAHTPVPGLPQVAAPKELSRTA